MMIKTFFRKKLIYVRESGGVTWARELTQSIIAIDVEEGPNAYVRIFFALRLYIFVLFLEIRSRNPFY